MKHSDAEALVERMEMSGGEAEIYEDYSGRAMYGSTTTGVVVNSLDGGKAIAHELNIVVRTDNMGKGYILY